MFYFSGFAPNICYDARQFVFPQIRFPHSDISGSKVAQHLPEAFRRHAASFIAHIISSHPPYALVTVLLENALTKFTYIWFFFDPRIVKVLTN